MKRYESYKIAQFGEGVFLRSFFTPAVQDINNRNKWDLSVSLIQPRDSDSVSKFISHGGKYHAVYDDGENDLEIKYIDVIKDGINTHESPEKYTKLAKDDVRIIVSNTTESGIYFDEIDADLGATKRFLVRSFPGKLLWLLYERYSNGINTKLYILPFELVENNGDLLKETIIKIANRWYIESNFFAWLEESVSFYNTLVDSIVTGYQKDEIYTNAVSFEDPYMVVGEHYNSLFVQGDPSILDIFPMNEIFKYFHFTNDLKFYRNAKISILNGCHTIMVSLGYHLGFKYVSEFISSDIMRNFLSSYCDSVVFEAISKDKRYLQNFMEITFSRYKNRNLKHNLESIGLNNLSKFRSRISPFIRSDDEISMNIISIIIASTYMRYISIFEKGQKFNEDKFSTDSLNHLFSKFDNYPNYDQLVEFVCSEKFLSIDELNDRKIKLIWENVQNFSSDNLIIRLKEIENV